MATNRDGAEGWDALKEPDEGMLAAHYSQLGYAADTRSYAALIAAARSGG